MARLAQYASPETVFIEIIVKSRATHGVVLLSTGETAGSA